MSRTVNETDDSSAGTGTKKVVRIAAVADLHCKLSSPGRIRPLFSEVAENADMLVLCGDLTDYGLPEEARILMEEIKDVVERIPTLSVLGNHDYESGKISEVCRIFSDSGIILLDGNGYELFGLGFTGVKGFAGGFGRLALQAWGEEAIKAFVREAEEEALKFEAGLTRLHHGKRVALLHYSPVRDTVVGEPPEIHAFLGSSRLEEPLSRYPVTVVFHGHAHGGFPEGQTRNEIPVYNVALPVLKRHFPEQPPVRVVEISTE